MREQHLNHKSITMKKLILTFGLFLAVIFVVNAQDKSDKVTTKMVNHITQVCGLSDDQVAKVQPIVADFVKTRIANKQQYANDPAGLKAANKTNRENYISQLKTVLTADQIEKLKNDRASRKNKSGGEQEE